MSKAKFFEQLETMSREELAKVAERVDQLRFPSEEDDLSVEELEMLRERISEFEKDPTQAEDGHVVVARILAELKK